MIQISLIRMQIPENSSRHGKEKKKKEKQS